MNNRLFICAAIILVFVILGILAYNNFEIYHQKTVSIPSMEALSNNFLAIEKWLNETGHPVRVENRTTQKQLPWYSITRIAETPERVAVVLYSACIWYNADEILKPWIEKGGNLVICLNYIDMLDDNLSDYLSGYGISVEKSSYFEEYSGGENIPDFEWSVKFLIDEDADIYTINDNHGNAKLAEVSIGDGTVTVTGQPYFMYNNYLNREINASLAWELTGARAAGDSGVLFVLDRYVPKAMFGKIMERGNFIPIGISALLVIFLGFWTVIPVFGLVFEEKQKSSRPIRERFNAEIRFLKKYGSLYHYLDIYQNELQLENDQTNQSLKYSELINKIRSVYDGTVKLEYWKLRSRHPRQQHPGYGTGSSETGAGKE
jgi:hypothetical protein